MPRRPPAQVRADVRARPARRAAIGQQRVSQLPGLSPRGRAILAFLEHDRLWPGQAEDALRLWRAELRGSYPPRGEPPQEFGEWAGRPVISGSPDGSGNPAAFRAPPPSPPNPPS